MNQSPHSKLPNPAKTSILIKIDFYLQLALILISLVFYSIKDGGSPLFALFLISILCIYNFLSSCLNLFILKNKNYFVWSIVNLITAIIIPLNSFVIFWGFGMAIDPNGPQLEKFPNNLVGAIIAFQKIIGFDNLKLILGIIVIFIILSYLFFTFQTWQKLKAIK